MCASALLNSDVKSAARGPGVRGMGGWGGGEGEAGSWGGAEAGAGAEGEWGWEVIFVKQRGGGGVGGKEGGGGGGARERGDEKWTWETRMGR